MDVRYSANQRDVKRYTTEELRDEFLIQDLYVPDEVRAVYSHVDRMVTLGCMPVAEQVSIDKGIDCWKNLARIIFWREGRSVSLTSAGQGRSRRMMRLFLWGTRTVCILPWERRRFCFPATTRLTRLSSIW